jgi:ophiobolin F synthase
MQPVKCTSDTDHLYLTETGGLFLMASKMMQAESTGNKHINIDKLMSLFGRYYQVRDDYNDVVTAQDKGTAAKYYDLDQGTFTLPIIHALTIQRENGNTELFGILQTRNETRTMSADNKSLFMMRLRELGSLEYTKSVLDKLHKELMDELRVVEEKMGIKNWILRLMLHHLRV